MAIQKFADGSSFNTVTGAITSKSGVTTNAQPGSVGAGGAYTAPTPVPPAGSYIINPGSVYQSYDPKTGITTYGQPPAGFSSNVAPGVSAPAVATPLDIPIGSSVYNGSNFVPLNKQTGYSELENGQVVQGNWKGVITPESLKYQDAIKLGLPQTDTNLADSMVAGTDAYTKSLQSYIDSLTPKETPEQKQYQDILNQMAKLTGEFESKGTDQLAAEQAAGIPALKAQFADINGQIATRMAEYNVLQTANQNKPITMNSIIGNERAILNAKAADIGLLQARAQALQGQIEVAQDTVNRAIDLKYSVYKARLDTYQAQLNAIKPILDKQEKIQAKARQLMIEEQKQALADAKEKEKAAETAKLNKIDMENKLAQKGYKYIATPAERDRLKAQGYDILEQTDDSDVKRTYAKAPIPIKSAGGGRIISGSGGGGGVSGVVSNTTQAIINNPSLFDDLTPTERGKAISELQANGYDTTNLGTKSLSDTAIKDISQSQKALYDLDGLKKIISDNLEYVGPITGLQKYNPWSKARKVQADIDRVKQTVGKALEGGVLRKEDEEKYKKILATLTDTPETALYKIDSIVSSIQRDIETYKNLQQASGRSLNVKESLQKENTEELSTDELRNKYNY